MFERPNPIHVSSRAFLLRGLILEFWILTPLLFAVGYLLGRLHNRRWRFNRVAALRRRLQLITSRIENKGMRRNGKRPSLKPWQKWFLALLHWWSPTLTRYTLFRPETLIRWQQRYVRSYWWLISSAGKQKFPGRPRIPESVEQIIVDIKAANPAYGAERIAAMVSKQLEVPVSESTEGRASGTHHSDRCESSQPAAGRVQILLQHGSATPGQQRIDARSGRSL